MNNIPTASQNAQTGQARLLRQLFDVAVASAQAEICVPPYLPGQVKGRLVVVGAGKASAAMAKAVEDHWTGDKSKLSGLVVTRYGHSVPCRTIEIVEASHPVPDEAGRLGAERLLAHVKGLSAEDVVLCLISGGGSALLPLPYTGISLADKQALAKQLLKSGASIVEMNCVRRHLSAIKGGRLAAACYPAQVITLVISDVAGDSLVDIASGPTVPDPTTCQDALDILQRYNISLPAHMTDLLVSGQAETYKPDDVIFKRVTTHLIATPQMALEAAASVAKEHGLAAHILGDAIEGEAKNVGKVLAGLALQVAQRNQPFTRPCLILSGGETTVTLQSGVTPGRGGRNVEFLLAFGIALQGRAGIYALAADTDGVDGVVENAGALWHPDTLARAYAAGMLPKDALARNDAHTFFEALNDAVITGPTLTNVNDFRAILIE